MLICDTQGELLYCNPSASALLACDEHEVPPIPPQVRQAAAGQRGEFRVSADGHERIFSFVAVDLALDGVTLRLLQLDDMTARQRSERALKRRIEFERSIVSISAALMRADSATLDTCIEWCLGQVGQFFGVDRAYLFRISADGATMSNTHEWVASGISREAANLQEVPVETFPWLMQRFLEGRSIHVPRVDQLPPEAVAERTEFEREGIRSIVLAPMLTSGGLWGFVGFDAVRGSIDWTEDFELGLRLMAKMVVGTLQSVELSAKLTTMAFHDPLTGLANRQLLEDRLSGAVARVRRHGQCLSLLLLDLDDFKSVNDRFGHEAGDQLLKQAGARLLALVRDADTVARLGGDEFVTVLEGASAQQAEVIVQRTREAFEAPFEIAGHRLTVRPSIGLACSQPPHAAIDSLLREADMAMYRAKAGKKAPAQDAAGAASKQFDLVNLDQS
ncbi:diguanylate cyclase [Pseudoxanthomonas sp. CAU 1598]|uniref:Diguanylate cyclase n=2 Tax=Pseudomarimonas arenosa TaxID=2774145 RepID=A0AAW3ZFU8_9GAMM|nr:GGDEF domain-containing protein [Pseudomarimonas arenosa]MBD8524214.1 diguanylate cyclase [Pseudomarimonas arenosa]